MNKFMKEAIKEAEKGIAKGHGGPFGCVIVKDGKIIGRGHNTVVLDNDPTCHGEMSAIRNACKNLKSFDLSGADLYTTGMPCPMCICAMLWANIDHLYYGATVEENASIGFRDEIFRDNMSISLDKMADKITQLDHDECMKVLKKYDEMQDKTLY